MTTDDRSYQVDMLLSSKRGTATEVIITAVLNFDTTFFTVQNEHGDA